MHNRVSGSVRSLEDSFEMVAVIVNPPMGFASRVIVGLASLRYANRNNRHA